RAVTSSITVAGVTPPAKNPKPVKQSGLPVAKRLAHCHWNYLRLYGAAIWLKHYAIPAVIACGGAPSTR
ncbi:MAG TPA: hypothetical protein VID30_04505, partial [Bradyrhizobium sp.]